MSVKPVQRAEVLGLSKGMVTEVNPLQGSGDSTVSEDNFELLQDGTRTRRLGLGADPGSEFQLTGLSWSRLQAISRGAFLWEGAGGDPSTNFVVIQMGSVLQFYTPNTGTAGSSPLAGTLNLGVSDSTPIKLAGISGYLILAGGSPTMQVIEYKENTFTLSPFRISIRDTFGIQETQNPLFESDPTYRGFLTNQHYYNLFNQSWAIPRYDWQYGDPAYMDAVFLGSNKNIGGMSPSNSDTVWMGLDQKPIGKDSENNFESIEAFHYKQFKAITGANTEAGKGFFIIDAFERGPSREARFQAQRTQYPETGGLFGGQFQTLADTTPGGPSSIASHAGRIFYSGCKGDVYEGDTRSPNYSNYVFFTQLVKNRSDFGKCYQEGDPSSRDTNTLLDTDGGFLVISGAVNIHSMFSMGASLFLIANNGVWAVSGGNNYGFSATNYKVDKLSNFGGIPNQSLTIAGDTAFFWGYEGVYTISKNQFGDYEVQNISKPVIDRYYKEIDKVAKMDVQGMYDKVLNRVRWLYTEGQPFSPNAISRELILDLNHKAFYPYSFATKANNPTYILMAVQVGDFAINYIREDVVVNGNPAVVQGTQVGSYDISTKAVTSNVKYVAVHKHGNNLVIRFTVFNDYNFEDWAYTLDPVDAGAHLLMHSVTAGDFAVKKQVPYLTVAFRESERNVIAGEVDQETSCLGSFRWNFTHLERSGLWTPPRQLYRKKRYYMNGDDIDNGQSLNITKSKLRGSGRAFALYLKTEPRKACHIYGWSISLTGNGVA